MKPQTISACNPPVADQARQVRGRPLMRILGIETSCDETAAAVVEKKSGKFRLLSSVVASSEEIHQKYGGIIPEKAAREQIKAILPVIQETLDKSFKSPRDCHVARSSRAPRNDKTTMRPYSHEAIKSIDGIAVAQGPGLVGSLIIGIEVAKTISFALRKPIIPVNHLLAHLFVNLLENKKIDFPAVGLIVSGGHTDLLFFKNLSNYQWLGGTRDDAAGECFDKTARLLGLGYPGGPELEACASKFKMQNAKLNPPAGGKNLKLPRPMLKENNFDFSFSGLKTAVLRKLQATSHKRRGFISRVAYEIQEAITDVLVEKTIKATEKYKAKSILVGGGVLANARLRKRLKHRTKKPEHRVKLFIPEKKFCTDNAAGIAIAGFFGKQVSWKNLRPNPGLEL